MKKVLTVSVMAVVLVFATAAWAVTIETVPVGDPNNAGEWSGESYGGYGPDRLCGAVPYEYRIGKYEVTAGQYCEFLNAVADADPYGLYNTYMDSDSWGCQITRNGSSPNYTYDFSGRPSGAESDWVNRPVNYVSWGDAARFATWLHNGHPTGAQGLSTTEDGSYYLNGAITDAALLAVVRESDWEWAITSEDEWYKAAYYTGSGSTYYDYPSGTNAVPSNDLLSPDGGNNANFYQDGGYTIGSPYYRTPVGEFELSESPYGTFDQGGNVWEWNEAILYVTCRGLRGGPFDFGDDYLLASSRNGDGPSFEFSLIGFRVSEVPEPTCLTILALGGLALLLRRRTVRG